MKKTLGLRGLNVRSRRRSCWNRLLFAISPPFAQKVWLSYPAGPPSSRKSGAGPMGNTAYLC